jgi:CheY-like chemotaxis protein
MSLLPKLRFLIVDPLDGVQLFARRLLEGYGFEPAAIQCAADPLTALNLGQVTPPDFLLTDWFGKHPELNGLQLHQRLRQRQPECRVGFMSFEITPEVQAAADAVGSRFLLKKPFGPEQLKACVQQAFESLAQQRPALMARVNSETGGRLDPRAGRRIELPPVPPPLRPGDAVRLNGKRYTVKSVVISKGEQLAELPGVDKLVPASRLSR